MKNAIILGIIITTLLYAFAMANGDDPFHTKPDVEVDAFEYSYDSPTDSENVVSETPLTEDEKTEPDN